MRKIYIFKKLYKCSSHEMMCVCWEIVRQESPHFNKIFKYYYCKFFWTSSNDLRTTRIQNEGKDMQPSLSHNKKINITRQKYDVDAYNYL